MRTHAFVQEFAFWFWIPSVGTRHVLCLWLGVQFHYDNLWVKQLFKLVRRPVSAISRPSFLEHLKTKVWWWLNKLAETGHFTNLNSCLLPVPSLFLFHYGNFVISSRGCCELKMTRNVLVKRGTYSRFRKKKNVKPTWLRLLVCVPKAYDYGTRIAHGSCCGVVCRDWRSYAKHRVWWAVPMLRPGTSSVQV